MGKVIEFPEYLNLDLPPGMVQEIKRRCGHQRRLIDRFVTEAIQEKLDNGGPVRQHATTPRLAGPGGVGTDALHEDGAGGYRPDPPDTA